MKKTLITLALIGIVLPGVAFADLPGMVGKVQSVLTGIGTALVIVAILIAGILFLLANGEPDKISQAKKALLWAIIGGVVVLGASTFRSLASFIAG